MNEDNLAPDYLDAEEYTDNKEFFSDGFHVETHDYKSKLYQEVFPNDTPEHAAIKVLSKSGFSNRQIAKFFGLSHTSIANILRRE